MKFTFLSSLLAFCLVTTSVHSQSFGIGTDAPDPQSILDIVSTDRGVFIPRMSTAQRDGNITPSLNTTDEGLFIYNNDDTAFNYWDGTQWVVFGNSASDDWTILGNTGTNAGTNFIGTTDAIDFVMRTNNLERARIDASGNFGIGTTLPSSKLYIAQTNAANALQVMKNSASGNGILLRTDNNSNTSSAIWIQNATSGAGINLQMLDNNTTSSGLLVANLGLGVGLDVWMANTAGNAPGVFLDQDGDGMFARGLSISMDAATISEGVTIFQSGIGEGQYIGMDNTTSTGIGSIIINDGLGFGYYASMTNTGANRQGLYVNHNGSGAFSRGIEVAMQATTVAFGVGIFQDGTGTGNYIEMGNTASVNSGQYIIQDGLGDGQIISLSQATNTASGSFILHDGNGTGQYIGITNTAATTNSIGLLVAYEGTGGGSVGGGNVAEFQHNGTNGNAVDIFIGEPSIAPGPANTTSDYAGLSISHMGTGTSGTASKSAITATNYSSDPTIVSYSNGTTARQGILSIAEPNGFVDPYAVYGYSYTAANNGYGIGVRGVGGWYGVHGIGNGGVSPVTFAVYGSGDYGGTGAKHFVIDYPLDPENKGLRHYSIESNEILNVYRGIATINKKGYVIVELPEYFDAVNTNPTYQLTSIGTPNQAYIKKEVSGNQFMIAGEPNTKVSWEVQANRNDPTIQYYDKNGKNYAEEVFEKPAKMKGKYYTPEAYGKDKSKGIHYDEALEKRIANMERIAKSQKAMKPIDNKVERQKQGPLPDIKVEKSSNNKEGEPINK